MEVQGAVPPKTPSGYAASGRQIFVTECAEKTCFFKQSFVLMKRPLVCLLFRPWYPGGSLNSRKSEKLHMRHVEGRELIFMKHAQFANFYISLKYVALQYLELMLQLMNQC